MEKVKIKSVYINEANKDGVPYIDKKDRKYKRVKLILEDDRSLSALAYGGEVFLGWKKGDEVEVVIEQNGNFLNFSIPDVVDRTGAAVEILTERVEYLYKILTPYIKKYEAEKLSKESL